MKKIKWYALGLFVLIIALAIGLSYLGLNEVPNEVEEKDDTQSMSIALVNEDEGTVFNGNTTNLGDEFTGGINKDNKHEWYVVSRGVAENGINRNAYDLMIVIPTNFSERSLSFRSEQPEPVAFNYKINVDGHEDVRAAAEKTAGNILTDFNKKLINVYFTSVIRNLQDAQDNISDMMDLEKQYTNEYKNEINDPLSNYTDQFGVVQDFTSTSKDSYGRLEDALNGFQTNLEDDVNNNQDFADKMISVLEMNEENNSILEDFSGYFDDFFQQMDSENVQQQLMELSSRNEAVHAQFQHYEDDKDKYEASIIEDSEALQSQFALMNESMEDYKTAFDEKMNDELEEVLIDRFDNDDKAESYKNTMQNLLNDLDSNVKERIKAEIEQLPMISEGAIEGSELAGATKENISKIAEVSRLYMKEEGQKIPDNDKDLVSKEINEIKDNLSNSDGGITVKDTIKHPKNGEEDEPESEKLFLTFPEAFDVGTSGISIGGHEVTYDAENGIDVSGYGKDPEIKMHLKLSSEDKDSFDIYSPVEWEWKVVKKEKTEETSSEDDDSDDEDEDANEENGDNEDASDEDHEEGDGKEEDDTTTSDENEQDTNGEKVEGESEEEHKDENVVTDNSKASSQTTKIKETNNYISKTVQSPLKLNVKERIIDQNAAMMQPYYKLQSLLELYFGFDINDELDLENIELKEAATGDSLYQFIHKNDIDEVLKEYLIASVKKDVQSLTESLETEIDEYMDSLVQADEKSDELAEKIVKTRENSNKLNEEVQQLLEELANWQESGQDLTENRNNVLASDGEMQTAVMNLDGDYQPLLSSSESLKDQANSNFDMAEDVYDTFEAIDTQAEEIKDSGTNIITKGNDLAEKLTQKSADDSDFAENFNDVLANSRIGDRQNQELYKFLSNPVQSENRGVVSNDEETLSPYYLIIVLFISSIFTGYVIHTLYERKQHGIVEGKSLIKNNLSISIVTAGIGLVTGLVIGLASFFFLKLSQSEVYVWIGLIVLLAMMLLFLATYLLRQLKTIGMFILLAIFGLYLIVTKTLGFHFENRGLVEMIQTFSPLQYAENLVSTIIVDNSHIPLFMMILLLLFAGIGFALNLLVYKKPNDQGMDDSHASEAN